MQVGLGSTVGSIDTIHTNAAPSTTGRQLDIAITGDGYFRVGTGNEISYTRYGNFKLSDEGDSTYVTVPSGAMAKLFASSAGILIF